MPNADDRLAGELRSLTSAVRAIAHGGIEGPTDLEALDMDLVGEGRPGHDCLTAAIRDAGESIGSGLHAVAEAIGRFAP